MIDDKLTNESKKTQDTAKHLDNKNLDEQVRVCSISERSGCTCNPHTNTAKQITSTDCHTTPEDREA